MRPGDDIIRPKRRFNPAARCPAEVRELRRALARAAKARTEKPGKARRPRAARKRRAAPSAAPAPSL